MSFFRKSAQQQVVKHARHETKLRKKIAAIDVKLDTVNQKIEALRRTKALLEQKKANFETDRRQIAEKKDSTLLKAVKGVQALARPAWKGGHRTRRRRQRRRRRRRSRRRR